jgi:hypothetical protein
VLSVFSVVKFFSFIAQTLKALGGEKMEGNIPGDKEKLVSPFFFPFFFAFALLCG